MPLQAALVLLEQLKDLPCHPNLTIRTDSRYLIDGFSKWMAGWKRKGWRTASGSPVLNRDLWEALDRARLPEVPFTYVKGHSGDPDNDRCDAIAVAFSKGGRPALAQATCQAGSGAGPFPAGAAPEAWAQSGTPSAAPSGSGPGRPSPAAGQAGERNPGGPHDPAPVALTQLLSRLELADRLAAGGFSLSLVELAQLVQVPMKQLAEKPTAWIWRDWRVLPHGDGRWRLERGAAGSDPVFPGT